MPLRRENNKNQLKVRIKKAKKLLNLPRQLENSQQKELFMLILWLEEKDKQDLMLKSMT